MQQTIFGEQADNSDLVIEVKYDGPSFNGVMEINALIKEISNLDIALSRVIHYLGQQDFDYEILVEAFERGSFKKKIKFVANTIEKYKTTATITAGFIGITITQAISVTVAAIEKYGTEKVVNSSPEVVEMAPEKIIAMLIVDQPFVSAVANMSKPLKQKGDIFTITRQIEGTLHSSSIDYSQKELLNLEAFSENNVEDIITTKHEEVYGKIISMDIDAIKNQISFKVYGKGERIYCSLDEKLSINNFTNLLGKWVTITGESRLVNSFIDHITVTSIVEEEYTGEQTVIE